ncbi:hypothetical protein FHG87_019760 [Trinorchestia longiramus]|nr:hypothetical protein FHG87_019760 [Trinorchestia longiramus]
MSKSTICHRLRRCDSDRNISACFCALRGQTEFRTIHFSYFGIKVATTGYSTFSGFIMKFLTRFRTIMWLKRNPKLDSDEHSIFHKQRCITSKELRPQSLGLFYLVQFRDKDLSYPSHFSRFPQSKTVMGMGSNSIRTDTCHL